MNRTQAITELAWQIKSWEGYGERRLSDDDLRMCANEWTDTQGNAAARHLFALDDDKWMAAVRKAARQARA